VLIMRRDYGFTLIELMIAVAVLALLAAIALPSYQSSLHKARRTEAMVALLELMQAQERWRSNSRAYTDDLSKATGLGISSLTSSGYYTIAVDSVQGDGGGYVASATAVAGKPQSRDATCRALFLKLEGGGNVAYGAQGADQSAPDFRDGRRCWIR
jgi:type IV pilus assembly protein PilE